MRACRSGSRSTARSASTRAPRAGTTAGIPSSPRSHEVEPGDTVTFEIRDSRDRAITRDSTHADLLDVPALAHPLTGPVEVLGAEPGDVLELEVLGYETDDFAWTAIFPGSGFLADVFSDPFLVTWELAAAWRAPSSCPGWPFRRARTPA